MKKRALLSTLLVASMVTGMLTGCGGNDAGSGQSSSQTEQSSASDSQAEESSESSDSSAAEGNEESGEESDAAGGSDAAYQSLLEIDTLENPNVTLDHYWDPDGRDSFEMAAIKRYEEKYGEGTVTVNAIGWNKGIETMQANTAAGNQSDLIFTEGNACFPSYVVDNYFQPITEYIQQDLGSDFMDQASMDNFKYKDEYYVFTNSARTKPYLVAYYIPMFEDNALETPGELYAKGEWTWVKFLEYCDILTQDTDGDGTIDQWGLGPRYKLQNFAYASGIIGIQEEGNGKLKANWEDENLLKYFEFVTKLEAIQARAVNDEGNVFNDGWLGTGAMYIEAINQEHLANRDAENNNAILGKNEDIGFVPIPTLDGSMATTPVWDNGYAIPNGAKNPLGGAVLAAMILDEYAKGLKTEQALYMTEDEIKLYYDCMANSIPQRKNDDLYAGVTMSYGEEEAKAGTPAATIIDTYKNVVASEVEAYNSKLGE